MPIQILMPALSPTMSEGTLAKWLKKEGDRIASGDVIAEIETDKATMEFEAADDGTLGKILVAEGTEGVAVNAPIALLLEEGEDASALDAAAASAEGGKSKPDSGPATTPQPKGPTQTEQAKEAAAAKGAEAAKTPAAPAPASAPSGRGNGRVFASPLARRLAGDAGVDLSRVSGSGPHGRIVKADVEKAKAAPAAPAAAPAAAAAAPQATAGAAPGPGVDVFGQAYEDVKHTSMRRTIAKRMLESKTTVPHFYLTVDCEIDALLALRKQLNDKTSDDAEKVSVNDMIIKACAVALRRMPEVNASYTETATRFYKDVDVSVAVAIDGGLITPIIRKADQKGLASIAREMKTLAKKAREGKLAPEEYQGGGFSVSNLGMFGIKQFEAIINTPQGAILAIGAGEQRPVVKDGALAIATVMTCTLSVDHRVIDGATGARFLGVLKPLIEDPLRMLL